MKKGSILMVGGLLALCVASTNSHATATTSTTTTVQTGGQPAATTTTTTKTTAKPTVRAVIVEETPRARDAITGELIDIPVPVEEEEKKSLRDEVREKIKEESGAK